YERSRLHKRLPLVMVRTSSPDHPNWKSIHLAERLQLASRTPTSPSNRMAKASLRQFPIRSLLTPIRRSSGSRALPRDSAPDNQTNRNVCQLLRTGRFSVLSSLWKVSGLCFLARPCAQEIVRLYAQTFSPLDPAASSHRKLAGVALSPAPHTGFASSRQAQSRTQKLAIFFCWSCLPLIPEFNCGQE